MNESREDFEKSRFQVSLFCLVRVDTGLVAINNDTKWYSSLAKAAAANNDFVVLILQLNDNRIESKHANEICKHIESMQVVLIKEIMKLFYFDFKKN